MAVEVGERQAIYESIENIAALETAVGRPERAARLFGVTSALRDAIGSPVQAGYLSRLKESEAATELALGHQQFVLYRQAGATMSEAAAIECATSLDGDHDCA
jgi:hypothetical protein